VPLVLLEGKEFKVLKVHKEQLEVKELKVVKGSKE
jgi:hypothetical protein